MPYDYRQIDRLSASEGAPAAGAADADRALSVSGALALAKGALQGISVRLVGEVSEVSNKPGYKAVYFTVKDERASLPCMMWNNRFRACGVELAVGQLVELTGRFSLYEAKGRMSFDVSAIALAGEGNLRLQIANLARKLQAEGLTAPERKRRPPRFPDVVGVVTSPRGDAVHDVLRTLRRRWPMARVVLAGVPVEGTGAPAAMAEGLRCVVAAGAQVVLLVRGGGSFEDMLPFSDEGLARMVAACPVPVITGIGHEPDTCIADMVADVRASTPTQAAQFASPSPEELSVMLSSAAKGLSSGLSGSVARARLDLERLAARPVLCDPQALLAAQYLALDQAWDRLSRALPLAAGRERDQLRHASERLVALGRALPEAPRQAVVHQRQRLRVAGEGLTDRSRNAVALAASRLHDLSPLSTVARGYAVVSDGEGRIVHSVTQVEAGRSVEVTLRDGAFFARVERTEEREGQWSKHPSTR